MSLEEFAHSKILFPPPTRSSAVIVEAKLELKISSIRSEATVEYLMKKTEALVAVSRSSPGAVNSRLIISTSAVRERSVTAEGGVMSPLEL